MTKIIDEIAQCILEPGEADEWGELTDQRDCFLNNNKNRMLLSDIDDAYLVIALASSKHQSAAFS